VRTALIRNSGERIYYFFVALLIGVHTELFLSRESNTPNVDSLVMPRSSQRMRNILSLVSFRWISLVSIICFRLCMRDALITRMDRFGEKLSLSPLVRKANYFLRGLSPPSPAQWSAH
jgi:hypothetical protein